jgi:hypothetical protein
MSLLKVIKDRYEDKAARYFYYDNTFRSRIYKAINSIFSYIVINRNFSDFFDSRVKFYHALEFVFVHLNMSRMSCLIIFNRWDILHSIARWVRGKFYNFYFLTFFKGCCFLSCSNNNSMYKSRACRFCKNIRSPDEDYKNGLRTTTNS